MHKKSEVAVAAGPLWLSFWPLRGRQASCLFTHRLHSSYFLWFIFRILSVNPKQELLWSPWVFPGMLALLFSVAVWDLLFPRSANFAILCGSLGYFTVPLCMALQEHDPTIFWGGTYSIQQLGRLRFADGRPPSTSLKP